VRRKYKSIHFGHGTGFFFKVPVITSSPPLVHRKLMVFQAFPDRMYRKDNSSLLAGPAEDVVEKMAG
jgi:hypothetical protein